MRQRGVQRTDDTARLRKRVYHVTEFKLLGLWRKRVSHIQSSLDRLYDLFLEIDLWTLPYDMLTASVSREVENNFYSRCEPENCPRFIQDRLENVSRPPLYSRIQEELDSEKATPRPDTKKSTKYDSSLFLLLYKAFFSRIWFAGLLKVFSGAFLRSFLLRLA